MIDLHMHTIFSDGEIIDIGSVIDNCEIFSITDHNTILAYKYYSDIVKNTKVIIGCEVTVDRAPDYLIYFPGIGYSDEIEKALEKIRFSEEEIIKKCYYKLGYNNWDYDIQRAFPKNQKVKNARTRDLAAIIHLYKNDIEYDNGKFDFIDLKTARKKRWEFAEKIGNSISENYAFEIAKMFNGKIVLAHPIHTAIKKCPKDSTNVVTISEKLTELIDKFYSKGGTVIEWEFFSEEHIDRYGLSIFELSEIRKLEIDKVNNYGFSFTIGSDIHTMENYDKVVEWLSGNYEIVKERLAEWIL